MMRLWQISYTRPSPLQSPATVSVVAHVLAIGLWAVGTLPPDSMSPDSLANQVYYIPPPNRPPSAPGSSETVHYITLADGLGAGPGPETVDVRQPIRMPERSPIAGEVAKDTSAAPPTLPGNSADSVFTILEVDSAVVKSQSSAGPAYPLDLLTKHVEGTVTARYVVDTTGFADVTSLDVLQSTNPGFSRAVEDALPYMRFSPAKIGPRKVRQLVEQSFTFRITPTVAGGQKP